MIVLKSPELPIQIYEDLGPKQGDRPSIPPAPGIEEALQERSPQFSLRNTQRISEEYLPPKMGSEFWILRDFGYLKDLKRAHDCSFEAGEICPQLSSQILAIAVAQHRVLMVETAWQEHFGHSEGSSKDS